MALDPTARIQANSGTVTGNGFTATLPNPTTEGSTLLLFFATNGGTATLTVADPPWVTEDAQSGTWYWWRRDGQPGGETSWAVSAPSSSPYVWRIEEWSGLSTIEQPDAVAEHLNTGGIVAPDTGTATTDVDDFAALALFRAGSSGTFVFPAGRSYPAGWTELDMLQHGDGTTAGDFMLMIAEAYPGAAGSVSSVLTWDTTGGGSFANTTVYGKIVCYRPSAAPPAGGILAVTG